MALVELILPKMGESIIEVTIINWLKKVGDPVEEDETILEIATDKVDSEVPAPISGTIKEILFPVDTVVTIGDAVAIIETNQEQPEADDIPVGTRAQSGPASPPEQISSPAPASSPESVSPLETSPPVSVPTVTAATATVQVQEDRFYSPLVKRIAKSEKISLAELDNIAGTGPNGRVIKEDILRYINQKTQHNTTFNTPRSSSHSTSTPVANHAVGSSAKNNTSTNTPKEIIQHGDEVIPMDRMRRLIADHMLHSVQTAPHVTSVVEADVTNLVNWRDGNKLAFQEKYGERLTYLPLFIECVVRALHDFPMVNASIDDNNIVVKKSRNIGVATALPTGNLIVPVIHNCESLNLVGITTKVNDLAGRARENKLKPDEIQGGTFTISNMGTFGNLIGTPIINQPELAILAIGAIQKKPVVIETEYGDTIAIRRMMYLSLSYDHRVVDGFLGGSFLKRIAQYIGDFDQNRRV